MQSTSKKDYRFLQIILAGSIILQMIFLFLSETPLLILFTSLIYIIVILLAFSFWLYFINPKSGFFENIPIMMHLILNVFRMKDAFLIINNGKFQQDYFLLKNKPPLGYLYICKDSAAVASATEGSLRVLAPGFHHIKNTERILLSFDLEYQSFIYGPTKAENPFDLKKTGENYTDFHARQLKAQKVKSFSKDACEIYPSFHITYQLGNKFDQSAEDSKDLLLEIAAYLVGHNMTGEAMPFINELLGKHISALWSKKLNDVTLSELFSDNTEHNINHILNAINHVISDSDLQDTATRKNSEQDDVSKWQFPFAKTYLHDLKIQAQ